MNQMPVYFSRMASIARTNIFERTELIDHTIKVVGSSLEQMTPDFAPLCDGADQLLGDNQKQSSKYKRIIYAGKIIAALKAQIRAWDIPLADEQIRSDELMKELSNTYHFAAAICKDSDIKRHDVALGIGSALFCYAASLSLHDAGLPHFTLLVRHLNKKQLQKLKLCMDFADQTDVFSDLGKTADPAKRKYKALRIKAEENPFHQLVDAFIAKRTMDAHILTQARVRKR